jgi:hypothetical protein
MDFWKSAFSAGNGNASILRVLLCVIIISVAGFINALTVILLVTKKCPVLDSGVVAFLTGLPVLVGALIRWGDSIVANTSGVPTPATPPSP